MSKMINIIKQLNPKQYRWVEGTPMHFHSQGERVIGLIAQEVNHIEELKHLVHRNNDGFLSIDYMSLVPLLVSAFNNRDTELTKQLDELNETMKNFQSEIGIITSRLNSLENTKSSNLPQLLPVTSQIHPQTTNKTLSIEEQMNARELQQEQDEILARQLQEEEDNILAYKLQEQLKVSPLLGQNRAPSYVQVPGIHHVQPSSVVVPNATFTMNMKGNSCAHMDGKFFVYRDGITSLNMDDNAQYKEGANYQKHINYQGVKYPMY